LLPGKLGSLEVVNTAEKNELESVAGMGENIAVDQIGRQGAGELLWF